MERAEHPLAVALRDVVDRLVVAIEEAPGNPAGSPEEATELVLAVCREVGRLQVASARLSTRADDDGLWAACGARSFAHWLAGAAGMSVGRARELVATGRALRDHLPAKAARSEDYYVCPHCGLIYEAEPPETCLVDETPGAKFEHIG